MNLIHKNFLKWYLNKQMTNQIHDQVLNQIGKITSIYIEHDIHYKVWEEVRRKIERQILQLRTILDV